MMLKLNRIVTDGQTRRSTYYCA